MSIMLKIDDLQVELESEAGLVRAIEQQLARPVPR